MLSRLSVVKFKQPGIASPVLARFRSVQAQPQVTVTLEGQSEVEYANALPYEKIPRPSFWQMMVGFAPGGRYSNVTFPELHRRFRRDYGDLMVMPGQFGRKDVVLTFRPDDFKKLFRTEGQWPNRIALETFVHYRKNVRPDVFKGMGGLVNEQGENWQHFRTIVNPVMMQPKTIRLYVDKLDEIAREFMGIISEIRDEKNEMPADFSQWLNRWALETVGVLALDTRLGVLGKDLSEDTKSIMTNIREFVKLSFQLDILPSIWRFYKTPAFKRLMTVLDELTRIIMAKVDEAVIRLDKNPSLDSDSQSVLEKLLKVNRDVAVVMAFDMLLAGVDTTSAATSGILYCLAKNPDKQARLREELRTILPNKDSPLTPDNMRNLPYLRACIKEGLRMYPPVAGNVRQTGKDIVLQGYQIPKGTDVAMAAMILHSGDEYFERGNEFLPERWLKTETGCPSGKDVHPFLFLPFGFGPRACVGLRMANLEMEILVARITRRFEYRWNYDDLRILSTLVLVPENDLKFQMVEVDD
uniref:Putative cytochrome p450 12a4 mitochondrial n=1 Tax=Culex tarsalis TaxID=7177 RepID=A0A1Q3FR33_CULTA